MRRPGGELAVADHRVVRIDGHQHDRRQVRAAVVAARVRGGGQREALALEQRAQLGQRPLADVRRVRRRAHVGAAPGAFAVGRRQHQRGRMLEQFAQRVHEAARVDQVFDDVGADHHRVLQHAGRQRQHVDVLEVGLEPRSERVPRAAVLHVAAVVHADQLELGMQHAQLARLAAADVDQRVAMQRARDVGGGRIDVRLPGETVVGRVGVVDGLGTRGVRRGQVEAIGRALRRDGPGRTGGAAIAGDHHLADVEAVDQLHVEMLGEQVAPPFDGAHGQVQVLALRAQQAAQARRHRHQDGVGQARGLAQDDADVVLGQVLQHVDRHEAVELLRQARERDAVAIDLAADGDAVEGHLRDLQRGDAVALLLHEGRQVAVARAEFEDGLVLDHAAQLSIQRQAFVDVVARMLGVAEVVEARIVVALAVEHGAGQAQQHVALDVAVRGRVLHARVPVVAAGEAVEAEQAELQAQLAAQRRERQAGGRVGHVRHQRVDVGAGADQAESAALLEIGHRGGLARVAREGRELADLPARLDVLPARRAAQRRAAADDGLEAGQLVVVEPDDARVVIDRGAHCPGGNAVADDGDRLRQGLQQLFSARKRLAHGVSGSYGRRPTDGRQGNTPNAMSPRRCPKQEEMPCFAGFPEP